MAEATDLLKSMDATLKQILALLQASLPKEIATDADLDGQYGDPQIKSDPKEWRGTTMKGRRMSECPVDYLEIYAEREDYFAANDLAENKTTTSGKPTAPYHRRDAARARGWIKRIKEGKAVTKAAPPPDEPTGWSNSADDNIDF